MILEKIKKPNDIHKVSLEDFPRLAEEIRSFLIQSVSETGGHLASNLGVVELTLALHNVLDLPQDKLIWDVGHQAYTHKILTGRKDGFKDLRKEGGLSGFPKRNESNCDSFDTGHSSNSISAGLGYVRARDLMGEKYHVVSVIGDGALTGGMAYEALNNVAELKTFVSNSLLFNQEANELYGQLYDAAEVNTDTLPEDVQQYFTNTVLYQPYLYAQMRGVSLETMLSQAGYSSVDEYLENSESSKQNMIKQILIMQALAEKNNIVCDTDILNAEFSRYFGSTDMTSYVNAYGENYVKTNILHDIVMQNQIDNVA